MAKITITTSEAVRSLRAVMEDLRNLKSTSNSVGLDSAKSLGLIKGQLDKIRLANKATDKSFLELVDSLKKTTSQNNKTKKAIEGTEKAFLNQIAKLRQSQKTLATTNESWIKYEQRINTVKNKIEKLTETKAKQKIVIQGTSVDLKNQIKTLKENQEKIATTASQWNRYEKRINTVRNKLDKLTSKHRSNKVALKGTTDALRKEINQLRKEQSALATSRSQWLSYENKITSVKGKLNSLTGAQKKTTTNFSKMNYSVSNLITSFGIIQGFRLFGMLILDTYSLIKQFDSIDFAMNTLVKRSDQLALSQSFLLDITESYGLEILSTSQRYLKFLASAQQVNLSLNDTQKIFRSVSKAAAVLGLKTDEVSGVYLALEQMLSKGKVTTEELRRQLGERLPGAMGIMASALDVSIPKLDKMLKKGEVLSSDALPKFAAALEEAYGIESVDKIDTLVSAQNRMNNSWKIFRKNLVESQPWLEASLKWAQNYTAEMLKLFSLLLGSEDYKLFSEVASQTREIEQQMKKSSTTVLNARAKDGQRLKEIDEDILSSRKRMGKLFNQDEVDAENENLKNLLNIKKDFNKNLHKENVKWAKTRIDSESNNNALLENEYKEATSLVEEANRKMQKASPKTGLFTEALLSGNSDSWHEANNALKELNPRLDQTREKFAESSARLNIFKALLEETFKPNIIPDDDLTPGKINTDQLDLDILKLKNNIKDIENFMKREDNSQSQRMQSVLDLFTEKTKLIDKEYEKELKLSQKNAVLKNIATETQNQAEEDLAIEYSEKKQKLTEKFFTEEITEIQAQNKALLDQEKINLKNKFDQIFSPSIKQKQDYNESLSNLEKEYENQSLKEQADFISIWLDSAGIQGEERVALERKILDLLAKLRADSSTKTKRTQKEQLDEELNYVREFLSEVSSLFSALSERKIEAIKKEIRAEEEKYDKLISLAENDASKKAALEKQKEDRIAVLEKKKLKERQKQAKIQKAFSLAEIAINTSIAYSKALTMGPIFGIPAAKLMLVLGAIQTAAVLATPIPQYKDGVIDLGQDETAMINDGGQKEYVERDGKILSTDTKNAIVGLKKGDNVYRNKKHMMDESQVYIQRNNSIAKINVEKQNISNEISAEIKKGFKGAKVNNVISLKNTSNNNYLKQKSRFNG